MKFAPFQRCLRANRFESSKYNYHCAWDAIVITGLILVLPLCAWSAGSAHTATHNHHRSGHTARPLVLVAD